MCLCVCLRNDTGGDVYIRTNNNMCVCGFICFVFATMQVVSGDSWASGVTRSLYDPVHLESGIHVECEGRRRGVRGWTRARTHARTHALTYSRSLARSHTHTLSLSLSLSLTYSLTHSLSLSHTHTDTHTYAHAHALHAWRYKICA